MLAELTQKHKTLTAQVQVAPRTVRGNPTVLPTKGSSKHVAMYFGAE
jgi:hypothetical protein